LIKLKRLYISNFKSLNEFKLEFSQFTCLIGLNSSGKSTILQAIDFVSQQMNGNISQWLKDRGWEANELNCKLSLEKKKIITSGISFNFNKFFCIWTFNFNPVLKKCTSETIIVYDENIANPQIIFEVKDSKYMILKDAEKKEKLQGDIIQDYEGSFLSSLKSELLPQSIIEFKSYMKNIYSLDLLAPQELRKRSRVGSKLGLSGENLSAFLNTFGEIQKNNLLLQLKKCYKNLDSFDIRKSKGGWSRLELVEKFGNIKLVNEAKYLNDGVLRLIAILSQLQSQESFLLFDEIENGINAELVEFLLDTLIASEHQIMITTHSPMILNYIDDDVAVRSVQYIYKTEEGFTKSIPFFSIPTMKEKLELMGPGEVYVDTNLSKLYEEIKLIEPPKKAE
jgi:predicted ATP-dependent endonuclease of OLD family